jgi:hypothetical protein
MASGPPRVPDRDDLLRVRDRPALGLRALPNLTRVMNIMGIQPLMAAIRA